MRLDPALLLADLEAIRALPADQRGFAAFEKRPQMMSAGAHDFDDFDFNDELALDAAIGRMRGGTVVAANRQIRSCRDGSTRIRKAPPSTATPAR